MTGLLTPAGMIPGWSNARDAARRTTRVQHATDAESSRPLQRACSALWSRGPHNILPRYSLRILVALEARICRPNSELWQTQGTDNVRMPFKRKDVPIVIVRRLAENRLDRRCVGCSKGSTKALSVPSDRSRRL